MERLPWVQANKKLVAALAENAALKKQIAETQLVPAIEHKLQIRSAVYGLETVEDIDVTEKLRLAPRNALAIRVDNNLVPRDPALIQPKRLEVEYSYGNKIVKKISRAEGELLVLPEDSHAEKEILSLQNQVRKLQQ